MVHRQDAPKPRRSLYAGVLSSVLLVALVFVVVQRLTASPTRTSGAAAHSPAAAANTAGAAASRAAAQQAAAKAAAAKAAAAKSAAEKSAAAKAATARATAIAAGKRKAARRPLDKLVAQKPRSYTSVAVYNYTTHQLTTAGAGSGMTSASVAKVQLLESLLYVHQQRKTALSSNERSLLTRMIEHSDNAAADAVFADIGGRATVLKLEPKLGLNTAVHHLGSSNLWGLTTTGAAQEVVLLKNLASKNSPITSANRRYARALMYHVESDQRWGVPVVADKGSTPAVKNGWLAVGSDSGRWAVNSIGLVRVHKQLLAIAVMTQHGSSFSGGISRVQALARAAVQAAV